MLVPVAAGALSGAAAGGTGWQPGAGRRRGQLLGTASTPPRGPAPRPDTSSPACVAAVQGSQAHSPGRTTRRRGECPALGTSQEVGLGSLERLRGWKDTTLLAAVSRSFILDLPSPPERRKLKTPGELAGPQLGESGDPRQPQPGWAPANFSFSQGNLVTGALVKKVLTLC